MSSVPLLVSPMTPSDWSETITLHAESIARVTCSIAKSKGSFWLVSTAYATRLASDTPGQSLFSVSLRSGSGTTVLLSDPVTSEQLASHMWGTLICEARALAESGDGTRYRGELSVYDSAGENLNSPEVSRHIIPIDEPALGDAGEAPTGAAAEMSELHRERRAHRETQRKLAESLAREESHALDRAEIQAALWQTTSQSIELNQQHLEHVRNSMLAEIHEAKSGSARDELIATMAPQIIPRIMAAIDAYVHAASSSAEKKKKKRRKRKKKKKKKNHKEAHGGGRREEACERVSEDGLT